MTGYIGLGTNLGDRWANLRRGVDALQAAGLTIQAASSVWESEPIGSGTSLWYLNMVVRVEARSRPLDLLDSLLEIERLAGRVRSAANGSRTLDLDLLMLGELRVEAPRLRLPHPRMWDRRFVLEPLSEIAPELRNPLNGRSVEQETERIRKQGVVVKVGHLASTRELPL